MAVPAALVIAKLVRLGLGLIFLAVSRKRHPETYSRDDQRPSKLTGLRKLQEAHPLIVQSYSSSSRVSVLAYSRCSVKSVEAMNESCGK